MHVIEDGCARLEKVGVSIFDFVKRQTFLDKEQSGDEHLGMFASTFTLLEFTVPFQFCIESCEVPANLW